MLDTASLGPQIMTWVVVKFFIKNFELAVIARQTAKISFRFATRGLEDCKSFFASLIAKATDVD